MNSISQVANIRAISICFWNINGVKNKFMLSDFKDIVRNVDIVIILETHFNIRDKCPENYLLVERSRTVESKKDRGGVAIYKKINSALNLVVLHKKFPDCLVCEIQDINIIIIAIYIPPNNSLYFSECSYDTIKLLINYYSPYKSIYIVGDLNSRFGNLNLLDGQRYVINTDTFINTNGRKLVEILNQFPNITLLNGLIYQNRRFDSKMIFFRGASSPQIDVSLTNNIKNTSGLTIRNKLPLSDHCPVILELLAPFRYPFDFINDCVGGFLSYNHYDINYKIKKGTKLSCCDLQKLFSDLDNLGNELLA